MADEGSPPPAGGSGIGQKITENTAPEAAKTEQLPSPKRMKEWMTEIGWSGNPFTFSINPFLCVGYEEQRNALLSAIEEKQSMIMVAGPTGSGKTSLLKWVAVNMPADFDWIYVGKPPAEAQELVDIFNNKYGSPWFLRMLIPNIKNAYQIPDFLNKRLKGKHLVLFFDEAHEAPLQMLEWMRVLGDQIASVSIVLSGLPLLESKLKNNLETLRNRITARIEVLSLTKEEMRVMIARRIESVGGRGTEPFTPEALDALYEKTGGFPREVLRLCAELVSFATRHGAYSITVGMIGDRKQESSTSLQALEVLTPMQREVVELLGASPASPGDIANKLALEKYKTRQHAVRSVNNVLIRMMSEGMVERTRKDKAYVYHLSPKLRTLVVKA